MFDDKFQRLEGESIEEYQMRLSIMKLKEGYDIDWSEIKELLQSDEHPDTLRRKGKGLVMGYEIYENKMNKFDSVGLVSAHTEVKIEDGEILVRGKNIMKGYYKRPDLTEDVMSDGWFRTGDIGYIDNDNFVFITGRKKNVIVLQGGKNVFPEELEEYLSNVKLVEEVVVVGKEDTVTGNVSVIALIYPNAEECEKQGLTDKEAIEKALNDEVIAINKKLASYKHVNEVVVRDEPFEKTPSRKIKRHVIKY